MKTITKDQLAKLTNEEFKAVYADQDSYDSDSRWEMAPENNARHYAKQDAEITKSIEGKTLDELCDEYEAALRGD